MSIFSFFILPDLDYFNDRVTFESNNLSMLVYLQGVNFAIDNFSFNNWFGLGFQNLGSENTIYNQYTYAITTLKSDGAKSGTMTGGFLAAKIISEFGVLGLFLVLAYLFYFTKSIFLISKFQLSDFYTSLSCLIVISFFVEMFIRSFSGYFSPSLFLVLVSVFKLNKIKLNSI